MYESARDAIGVFETTSGEYKVVLCVDSENLHVQVTPENVPALLRELDHKGFLVFVQHGFTLFRTNYYESLGAFTLFRTNYYESLGAK